MYSMYGIHFDDAELDLARQGARRPPARSSDRPFAARAEEFAGNELVGVVLDEGDLRAILLVDAAREIVRDRNHAADEASFQIVDGVGQANCNRGL